MSDKIQKLADVARHLEKNHKYRAQRWDWTEDGLMVAVDAKTGEKLSEPIENPWLAPDAAKEMNQLLKQLTPEIVQEMKRLRAEGKL